MLTTLDIWLKQCSIKVVLFLTNLVRFLYGSVNMISINKQTFLHAMKNESNLAIYVSTTFALLATLGFQEVIRGTLKPEHFGYALLVSFFFVVWAIIDGKFRKS